VIAFEAWARAPADLGVALLVGLENDLSSAALERHAAVSANLRRRSNNTERYMRDLNFKITHPPGYLLRS